MSDSRLRAGLAVVALAGLVLSAYLTWVHYDERLLVCTVGGGCEAVQESKYATLAGIPIALLGAFTYTAVLGLLAWDTPAARVATAALGSAAFVFALYLVVLQLFVIEATCVWCMVNDLVIVPLLAALSLARVARSSAPGGAASA